MRSLFSLLALGLVAIGVNASSSQQSNLTYFGAPRLDLDGVPPHFDVATTAASAPSCGKNSGSASRRVAYYQSWNSRRRDCDKVLPSQLDLTSITHLVLAFATIDPKTFQVGFMNKDDEDIYKQFLVLPDNVSKWIGIGGFEFSDPGPTRTTWSDMVSSQSNRKAFIDSVKQFLSKWQFRGVDIDWEWPGHPGRGGRSQDAQNHVQLVKEMRQALGKDVGLGVVLPAQYDYMSNMDPKGLEAHVDWMGIVTYDLHGQWDKDIPGLGAKIKPHTDLKEIDAALNLLWSKDIDSKKVNLGIANYGRGYTVADKNCMYYGCTFTGPSKKGSCTSQEGVLSTCEIRRLISEKKLNWKVIAGGAEVNEVTWDDQWIGFDDAGTLGKKLALANGRCLGGTALWAIDYSSCPSDGGSPQPSQPGNPVSPSASAAPPASSKAPSGPPTSAAPSSAPGPSPSGPGSPPPATPSSGASSSIASSPQGTSPAGSGTPAPAPSPGPSSAPLTPPSSGSLSIPPSPSSSVQQSSPPGSSQNSGSSGAPPSSSGGATIIPVPVPKPSSPPPGPSNPPPSSNQPGSTGASPSSVSVPSPTPGVSSSTPVLGSSGGAGSSNAPASTSNQPSTTQNAPSATQSGSPVGSSTTPQSPSKPPVNSSGNQVSSPPAASTSDSAKSSNSAKPSDSPKSSDAPKSSDPAKPTDPAKSSGSPKPSTDPKPSEAPKSTGSGRPNDPAKSTDPAKPNDPAKSTDPAKPNDPAKPSGAPKPSMSSIPGERPWCPPECLVFPWCNKFCDIDLPEVPPPECWWYDWCWVWWGYSRHKKDEKDGKKCKILGCGCGWMGLPYGPGCPVDIPWWIKIIIKFFGLFPDPCKWWGCNGNCGIFGCDGWCFGEEGCAPCPKEICKGQGPKPGPMPTPIPPNVHPPKPPNGKPKKCDPKDMKTAVERYVACNELVSLSSSISATTTSTWVSTQVTTATSSSSWCSTWLDVTMTGCNVVDDLQTKTISQTKSNSISSETPGPACTRAPLSLDDDEGDNIGNPGFESTSMFGNMTDVPSQTSTMFKSTTSTSSSATPTCTDNRPCWNYFDKTCVVQRCSDTNDPEFCAYRCLSDMCLAPNAPKDCWQGNVCAHPACPHEVMGAPAKNFTVTITYPSNGPTKTWTIPANSSYGKTWFATPTPTSSIKTTWSQSWSEQTSFEFGTSTSATPKPTPGPMDKNGRWTVKIKVWRNDKEAHVDWALLDPNGNEAGKGSAASSDKPDVQFYVESKYRPLEHMMPFGVNGWLTDWAKFDNTRVKFEIQKEMVNCFDPYNTGGWAPPKPCKPYMWTENRLENKMFEVDTCWQYCKNVQDRKLLPSDMNCNDLNDADWYDRDGKQHRDFECYWKGF